jgi:pimeloyl-ACP methyl ester carboxylesterase
MDDVAALREDSSAVEHLGIAEIVDHYAEIISALDRPPIIMGHSFGGAFTEILLDRGLGAAGVAIDAAAVKGITKLPLSTLRSAWPVLKSPANRHKTVMLSPEEFHYAFTNTMTEEESQAVYNAYAVPGPGRVLFQGALANFNPHSPAKVDFKKDDRAPLLLISGGSDHVVPAAVDASVAKHYEKSDALTEYKEFPGRRTTRSARRAGKRSPTTPSTGPSSTPLRARPPDTRRASRAGEDQERAAGNRRRPPLRAWPGSRTAVSNW